MKYRYKYFDKIVIHVHIVALILSLVLPFFKKAQISFLFIVLIVVFGQLFVFLFYTLPMLILLKNYKAYNKDLEVKLESNDLQLTILNTTSNIKKIIAFEDILKIYKIYSYNKSYIHSGYMDYFYFELVLKNGESEIITCLINEDLDKYIHQSKVRKVSKFYPYIKYSVHESFE